MAYTDISYCDSVLTSIEWLSSPTTEKQAAIDIGELWIDKYYDCTAESPVQDAIQKANSMLAELYVKDELFSPSSSATATSNKKVKIGSIEINRTYESGGQQAVNLFAEIDFLLGATCPVNPAAANAITIVRA